MSRIQKSFKTKYTTMEMKNFINANILTNSALSTLLESADWFDNELEIKSKLGSGKIILSDYRVDVDITLSIFGSFAKNRIESTLDNEFKKLN